MTRPALVRHSGSQKVRALAEHLPVMTAAQADLSRLTFDGRFERWLRQTLGLSGLAITDRSSEAGWLISLDTDHGGFKVVVNLADWPSLLMALEVGDSATACSVVTLLLKPVLEALAPVLGPVRIIARSRSIESVANMLVFSTNGVRFGLYSCDADLVDHLGLLANQFAAPDISAYAPLMLRARIQLMVRAWSRDVIQSLQHGDVVLVGAQHHTLIGGIGCSLQVGVQINLQEHIVQVVDDPYISTADRAAQADSQGHTLDELQVPVAFELDTARISLADLAGMRPGYSVELDVPLLEATVRLVCHGQTLGYGQLVAIGDQLGVRITRMEFAHDAAVPS